MAGLGYIREAQKQRSLYRMEENISERYFPIDIVNISDKWIDIVNTWNSKTYQRKKGKKEGKRKKDDYSKLLKTPQTMQSKGEEGLKN